MVPVCTWHAVMNALMGAVATSRRRNAVVAVSSSRRAIRPCVTCVTSTSVTGVGVVSSMGAFAVHPAKSERADRPHIAIFFMFVVGVGGFLRIQSTPRSQALRGLRILRKLRFLEKNIFVKPNEQ